ncbi:MAG: flagellar filament capping protein FliD [Oscillibacter sp.]|nr:flagellar filament capping protein FliD [Oscillibacter sp.]
MAVSGVRSSSSIYGSRNVITGLASGMDTESMIENAISGFKTKINALGQKRTKLEWQQEAYRSIVTKMTGFTGKYADYRSSTNLMSPSFFNQAIKTVSQGANASKVSASGKTNSSIQINGVRQLAKAATYRVSGGALNNNSTDAAGNVTVTAGGYFDLGQEQPISTVSGSISITYGGTSARSYLDVSFGELDNFANAQEMADHINKQLETQNVTTSSGASVKATSMIKAKVEDGNIVFEDVSGGKNEYFISSASGEIAKTLGVQTGKDAKSLTVGDTALTKNVKTSEYLSYATMDITLDGVTKKIQMPSMDEVVEKLKEQKANGKDIPYFDQLVEKIKNGEDLNSPASRQLRDQAYMEVLQDKIDDKFGTLEDGSSKLTVNDANDDNHSGYKGIQLQFTAGQKGSSFLVTSSKSKAMGLGENGTASYLSTNKTLKDLGILSGLSPVKIKDADGNEVDKTDANGKKLYEFTVNGVKIGEFTEDTSVSTIMNQINGNKDAGVNVSYSKATNEFTFTAKETGMAGRIEFGDGLGKALFGDTSAADAKFEKGQDAIFSASINGVSMELTRSSNTVDMDGMSVTLKGEFGYKEGADGKLELDPSAEAVTFSSSADADKIVDAIKSMVNDYNEMVKEIKEAYSTLPMQKSTGQYYEPLTDEDMEDMSETAIENWNNKAKAGILFGDQDLRSLYQRMTQAISMTGADGADLKAAGITVNYANGLTTLAFDENKLRSTLETDPDRVTDIFTKSTDSGSSTKGFLQALKEPLDLYGKTEGVNLSTGTKGVLVNKAGHPLAASTMYNNNMQKQLDKIDKEIERWQDKMSDRVDYYTNKFSQLEQLIAQMNSQSSTLAGLMGNMG